MFSENVVSLTKKIIAINTINPPGNEAEAARFISNILTDNGFDVKTIPYGKNRLHVIAEKGCSKGKPALVFTGHFDTVPLGAKEWSVDPFEGLVKDGKLYGRGSSDMKGGMAAMVLAAISAFESGTPQSGVRLIFTADEETGCNGAKDLISVYTDLGKSCGIIVGEPTANLPAIGHKGGLYLKLTTKGLTAHSSMPHLGENAIYKAARAIVKIEKFDFGVEGDSLLGMPTLNVGKVLGGMNLNSVPDYCEFTIDARTTTKVSHEILLRQLKEALGEEVSIETLVNLTAVSSVENDPFVKMVYEVCGISTGDEGFPKSLPYLTDASVLQPAYGGVPTIILGPGSPQMAHQTDEFCTIENLEKAVELYKNIILKGDWNHE